MLKKFEEAQTLPEGFARTLMSYSAGHLQTGEEFTPMVAKGVFMGIADLAAQRMNKEQKIAIVVPDLRGEPVLTAVAEWIEGEGDDEDTGNYTLAYKFGADPSLEADVPVYKTSDPITFGVMIRRLGMYHVEICGDPSTVYYSEVAIIMAIKQWLDDNTSKDVPVVTLEMDGFFQATCELKGKGDNAKKVFSIEPQGFMKTPVKNDESVQK